jgi:hypothetical protein
MLALALSRVPLSIRRTTMIRIMIISVAAATVMHEQVHHQAAANQKPGQGGDDMRLMLGPQEIPGNAQEARQYETGLGEQKPSRTLVLWFGHLA